MMKNKIDLTAEIKYQLLRDISHKIEGTLDLDKILNLLLDILLQVIDYDAAGIFILNEDLSHPNFNFPNQKIAGIAKRGYADHPAESDEMLSKGKGIIGYVIKSKQSVILDDVRKDERYLIGRNETLSEAAVPIIKNDKSIGALDVESDKVAAYDRNHLEILEFFADAAAISLDKAIVHQQILEKKKLEEQIRIAKDVQSNILPANPPTITGYEIYGICIPTFDIGGDYYDYIELDKNNLAVVIADVSGEGIPAALIMAAFRAMLRNQIKTVHDPAKIMDLLNQQIPEVSRKRDFITAFYGKLNHDKHTFTFSNAGHNPPILLRKNSDMDFLQEGGPSLNILKDAEYFSGSAVLFPGDMIILYTDGVTEIFDDNSNEFGLRRFKELIIRSKNQPVNKIVNDIVKATKDFSGRKFYRDDFTLVILKRKD